MPKWFSLVSLSFLLHYFYSCIWCRGMMRMKFSSLLVSVSSDNPRCYTTASFTCAVEDGVYVCLFSRYIFIFIPTFFLFISGMALISLTCVVLYWGFVSFLKLFVLPYCQKLCHITLTPTTPELSFSARVNL